MPFAQSNTSRLWVRYTVGGFQHEILFRNAVGGAPTGLIASAQNFCSFLALMMHDADNFVSARYSDLGSGFSAPVAWTVIPGEAGTGLNPGDPESRYLDFIGRDQTFGARVRWSFFTRSAVVNAPVTNRYQPGDNTLVDDAVTSLQFLCSNPVATERICAISKGQPVVYPYVNTGWNAYWQRQQRA